MDNNVKPSNNQNSVCIINRCFTPEYIFLILALFFGILFVFLTPPFQVPDEGYHYSKSVETSEFYIWPVQNGDSNGYYSLASIINFPHVSWPVRVTHPYGSYESILSQINVPLNQDNIIFFSFSNVGNNVCYSPVGYLPQAAGMLFGRLLKLSPLLLFYCGRLANLGVWTYLTYLAIRKIPFAKWLVVGISLMPMTLFEAASLAPDALNNGLCILFIAYVIFFAVNKNSENPLSNNEILILLLLSIAISLIKGYFFLSLLLFILPVNAFYSKQKYSFTVLFIILLSTLTYVLWQISNFSLLTTSSPGVSPHDQLQFILTNPFDYGFIILTTCYSNWLFYLSTFIGVFGWLDIWLPQNIYYIFLLCLIVLAVIDNSQKISLNVKQKTICIIIFAIISGMIATNLWITWTVVGASVISGIQGRYFIPIALLCFILFNNSFSFNQTLKKIIIFSIVVYITGVLFFTLDTICTNYYTAQISVYLLTVILLLINIVILICCYFHFNSIMLLSCFSKTKLVSLLCISLSICILLSLVILSIIYSTDSVGVFQVKADTPVGEILGETTVGQTFYSPLPELSSIDIELATWGRTNTKGVIFHLRESPESSDDIATIHVNAKNVMNNAYNNFRFPAIKNSANKSYYFFIESPESVKGNAITIWSSKNDTYTQGTAYVNSKSIKGDLAFRVNYALQPKLF
jgi:uncharacterized membrane protein